MRLKRKTFNIDFLGIRTEMAQVLPDVTVRELIQDILVEFGLDHLHLNQHRPQDYVLRTAADGVDLAPDQPLHQISGRGSLFFREKALVVPSGAEAVTSPIYFRYRSHVFKVGWTPALIGRPIPGEPDNALLAVNLEPFSLSVSRRHAELIQQPNGRFVIRCLNDNPILLNGTELPFEQGVTKQPTKPLTDGDRLLFQHAGLELTCLRPDVAQQLDEPTVVGGGVS